jgi:hypothetical protein
VYVKKDTHKLEKISITRKVAILTIGKSNSGEGTEYEEVVGDPDGRVLEGKIAPTIEALHQAPSIFAPKDRGSVIEPRWQYQLEWIVRSIYSTGNHSVDSK